MKLEIKLKDLRYTWTSDAAKAIFDQIQDEISAHADRTFGHQQMTPAQYQAARRRYKNEVENMEKKAASLLARFTVPKPIVIKK